MKHDKSTLIFLLFLFQLPVLSFETLAYRFVDEPSENVKIEKCPIIASPPAESPFVKKGDVLRDLTSWMREEKIPIKGGWVIWNQTQRSLIVHGAMTNQWNISNLVGFERQEVKCGIKVEWLRTEDSKQLPKETDAPFASLTLRTESGHQINGKHDFAIITTTKPDGEWTFHLEATPWNYLTGATETTLNASVEGPVGVSGEFSTELRLVDQKPLIAASWQIGQTNNAWWLRLTSDVLFRDGSSQRNARLRQTGDTFQYWPNANTDEPVSAIPEKFHNQVIIHSLIPEDVIGLFKLKHDQDNQATVLDPNLFPEINVPEWLIDIAAPPMLDLRSSIQKMGHTLKDNDFCAYDIRLGRIICASHELGTLNLFRDILMGMCGGGPDQIEYQTSLYDANQLNNPLLNFSAICFTERRCSWEWHDPASSTHIAFSSENSREFNERKSLQNSFSGYLNSPNGKAFSWCEKKTHLFGLHQTHVSPLSNFSNGKNLKQNSSIEVLWRRY